MGKNPDSLLRFGAFEVDLATAELRKGGRPAKLQPQPFRVLALLLERPGELITREEIHQALWGNDTFVDFDQGLNFAIKEIRRALGDDAERPRYVETLHRRGYRFIAKLERGPATPLRSLREESPQMAPGPPQGRVVSIAEAGVSAHEAVQAQRERSGALAQAAEDPAGLRGALRLREGSAELGVASARGHATAPGRFILIAAAAVLLAGAVIFRTSLAPEPAPKVLRSVQLTHTGRAQPHSRVLTDGGRIYFTEKGGGSLVLAQIPVTGGNPTVVDTSSLNAEALGIDPSGANLLFGVPSTHFEDPVWVVPTVGGSARRLGDAMATDAAWSPDGRWVAYTRESGAILVIPADGGPSHRLLQANGFPSSVLWSPDGKTIWFSVRDNRTSIAALWEVDSGGGNPRRVLEEWQAAANAGEPSVGTWSPDGRYMVFRSGPRGPSSLWAVRIKKGWFGKRIDTPVQLYTSPDQIGPPSFSRDGKRLYFVDFQPRRELVRYDDSRKQFVPYLAGIPAIWLSFSKDGQWVAYRQSTDGTLWRSRPDGSERLQLTLSPMDAYHPSWSPAGDRIAFSGGPPGSPSVLYTIPAAGGSPTPAAPNDPTGSEPSWSPDGRSLLFRRWNSSSLAHGSEGDLYLLDLGKGSARVLPGSANFPDGFKGAQWSPDGHYAAALERNSRLMLFDFRTERWSQLASGTDINAVGMRWSADSRFVYYQDLQESQEQPIFRVHIPDGLVERIASSRQVVRADLLSYSMVGLTPDGSPLASLLHSSSDIYALDLSLP